VPTQGQVVALRSPGSSQLLERNGYESGTPFGPTYTNGEDRDHLGFECDDVGRTVEELERKEAQVRVRPKEIGGWTEAFVEAPNGIGIELVPGASPVVASG
jgi:catechol 2,3-dioxygenase-like lactoylglutathione lyase family enzyme